MRITTVLSCQKSACDVRLALEQMISDDRQADVARTKTKVCGGFIAHSKYEHRAGTSTRR